MNILIIEDDELKHSHLEKFAKTLLSKSSFTWKKSYQSGLQEILSNPYDLVLLDMSMHIYEKTAQETGGSFETYAGRMILNEIDMNEITTKVIVITGYDVYNDGKTLATLKKEIRDEFGNFYLDTVYFIGSEDKWKTELTQLIKQYFPNLFMVSKINTYLSILLVEDNEHKAAKVKNFIEDICTNTKIVIAKDQMQALQYLTSEKFDLMLLDMQLPIRFDEGEPQIDGGKNILQELEDNSENYKTPSNIIGLTQFEESKENFEFHGFMSVKFDASSEKWKDTIQKRLIHIENDKKTSTTKIYCEGENDKLFNLIGFQNIEFIGIKDSRAIFLSAKKEKDKFALRDKDFLTHLEVEKLKQQFTNYLILDYYCFENYLYHPDNIQEINVVGFDKKVYTQEIINQKNNKINKILFDVKTSRNGYLELNDTDFGNKKDNEPERIIGALLSNEFEIFYPYFDMKGEEKSKGFDKTFMSKYNLKQENLVKTKWFKQQMEKVLEKVLTK